METIRIKTIYFIFLFNTIITLNGCASSVYESRNSEVNYSKEYNIAGLNQYGEWIDIPVYGRVWKPFAVIDWEPFHNGHWIRSNNEWIWNSYEPFGWVVYHYGYWYDDFINGWVWIPDNTGWSPANVIWYNRNNYIGWAPRPPKGIVYGDPWDERERRHWHIVSSDHFADENIGHLSETHTSGFTPRNSGERNLQSQSSTIASGGNERTRSNPAYSNTAPPSIYVRPSPAPDKQEAVKAPDLEVIEQKSGKKVDNIPVTREPVKLNKIEIHRMVVPEKFKGNSEKFERDVKEKVLKSPGNKEKKERDNKER